MSSLNVDLHALLESGAHFGHQSRRWNPKMRPYIYQTRDNIHVIDLTLTATGLKEAYEYLYELAKRGGKVMFVGTKRQAKEVVKAEALRAESPFVAERWIGGMLTNWDTILQNIKRLQGYKSQKESGELARYTKKEQSLINKEIERLEKIYEGLLDMAGVPDAIFVVDVRKEKLAVKEAHRRGIAVIGICDTNSDPSMVDIVIPANDDALKAVTYIVSKMADAVIEGKKQTTGQTDKDEVKASATAEPKPEAPAKKTRAPRKKKDEAK